MSETPLPALYARWIEDILGTGIPSEPKATCLDCAMCAPRAEREGVPEHLRFRPDVKCCSYNPHLANFHVGLILRDESPEALPGRARVERQIRERLGATPLGLSAAPDLVARYDGMQAAGTFGRDASLLCRYFDTGACTVWRHREAVCSTFFCKHRRGVSGARFWAQVKALLVMAERELTAWCLLELGAGAEILDLLLHDHGGPRSVGRGELRGGRVQSADGRLSPELARRCWGAWYGEEVAFYRACGQLVADLPWSAVRSLARGRAQVLEGRVRAAFEAAYGDRVPDVLCRTTFEVEPLEPGEVHVRTCGAPYEPLRMPEGTFEALSAFDGRPTADVLDELRADGTVLDNAFVRVLTERGVLLPPDGIDVPRASQPRDPLEPRHRVAFFRGFSQWPVTITESSGEGGHPVLTVACGVKQVEFEEPDLHAFARHLSRHPAGFEAGLATGWGPDGSELPWERVKELLEALLEAEVLQRLPHDEV